MMITEKQVQEALKIAIKKSKESKKAVEEFDKLAGKYFDIKKFEDVYQETDELSEPLIYANGNLTWNQLCNVVKEFKIIVKGRS